MRPLRVVQIVNGLALNTKMGGAERFGVELARHLDRDWIDPIVVGLWAWDAAAERPWRELLVGEGIRTVVSAPRTTAAPRSTSRCRWTPSAASSPSRLTSSTASAISATWPPSGCVGRYRRRSSCARLTTSWNGRSVRCGAGCW
ncbi:MAG: hypothetical protein R2856_20285 [Caldilineaceae bacterium]